MKKFLLFFFALTLPLSIFAELADSDYFPFQASKERVLDRRENYFLTSTDYRITPKVNPVTGEYCEEELDLVVAGSEPLSVRRYYNSSAPYDPRKALDGDRNPYGRLSLTFGRPIISPLSKKNSPTVTSFVTPTPNGNQRSKTTHSPSF